MICQPCHRHIVTTEPAELFFVLDLATQAVLRFNVAQRGDALELLRSLPDCNASVVFFDPQHRSVLDHLKFGNEGARQVGETGPITEHGRSGCHQTNPRGAFPLHAGFEMKGDDRFG
jgi:hypothetical protein